MRGHKARSSRRVEAPAKTYHRPAPDALGRERAAEASTAKAAAKAAAKALNNQGGTEVTGPKEKGLSQGRVHITSTATTRLARSNAPENATTRERITARKDVRSKA